MSITVLNRTVNRMLDNPAFRVAIEALIDDARRENVFGLLRNHGAGASEVLGRRREQ